MKKLIRPLLLAMILLNAGSGMRAQDQDPPRLSEERMKEIKAQKSAFLTTKLALTPEEAQKFWPIYNEMDDKREAIRHDMRDFRKSASAKNDGLTEAQAAEILDKALAARQKEIDLERQYTDRFKKAIGARKTLQLDAAERDFHREVLRKFRERVEERRGDGKGDAPQRRH